MVGTAEALDRVASCEELSVVGVLEVFEKPRRSVA
jgi:hypothetical protein